MKRKIKTAIVGYGKMGQIRESAINKLGHDVVCIYDINTNIQDMRHVTNNINDIYNNNDIEAVFICTPNCFNKDLTIKGLLSGKHVFCEKPPALTLEQLQEVIKVEKQSKKKLMYGFNHRHHKSVKHMKSLIDHGDYGKILWMRGRYGKSTSPDFFDTWRSKKNISGGGIVLDQGIHLLDLFIYMGGGFDRVESFLSNDFWKIDGIEDNAFMIFKNTKKNITASLHSTMTQWRHIFSFEVFLENGWMILNGLKTSSNSYGNEILTISDNFDKHAHSTPNEVHEYNVDSSWTDEVKYFFNCILHDKPIEIANIDDASMIMKTIGDIYKNKDF